MMMISHKHWNNGTWWNHICSWDNRKKSIFPWGMNSVMSFFKWWCFFESLLNFTVKQYKLDYKPKKTNDTSRFLWCFSTSWRFYTCWRCLNQFYKCTCNKYRIIYYQRSFFIYTDSSLYPLQAQGLVYSSHSASYIKSH